MNLNLHPELSGKLSEMLSELEECLEKKEKELDMSITSHYSFIMNRRVEINGFKRYTMELRPEYANSEMKKVIDNFRKDADKIIHAIENPTF